MNAPIFKCRKCGDCCFGRGGVRFTDEEAAEAALYLKLSLSDFHRLYLVGDGPPWDIGLDFAGYCRLRQPGGLCLVHSVKPAVCRAWPWLAGTINDESAFKDAKEACPGLRRNLTWTDFKVGADL